MVVYGQLILPGIILIFSSYSFKTNYPTHSFRELSSIYQNNFLPAQTWKTEEKGIKEEAAAILLALFAWGYIQWKEYLAEREQLWFTASFKSTLFSRWFRFSNGTGGGVLTQLFYLFLYNFCIAKMGHRLVSLINRQYLYFNYALPCTLYVCL